MPPSIAVSAAAEHVATTVLAVEEVGANPTSNKPPEVKLRRTLLLYVVGDRMNDHKEGFEGCEPATEEKGEDRFSPSRYIALCLGDPPKEERLICS